MYIENHSLGEWYKRQLPMRKNKTSTVIVGMRSGNSKLQNRGRPFKNEVAETV